MNYRLGARDTAVQKGWPGRATTRPTALPTEEAMETSTHTTETVTEAPTHERDDVDGGQLVYGGETEHRGHLGREVKIGRELVGFANVTDWDGIRSALAKRGHGVGAMHHLDEFDDGEVGRR